MSWSLGRSQQAIAALSTLILSGARAMPAQVAPGGPPPTIAITGVTVIDGTGAPPRPARYVVIRDGRIAAVGDSTLLAGVPGATVVQGRGRYLIPGLWDMHVHVAKGGEQALSLYVANGVTSVRDMGGDFALVRQWRDEIGVGARAGPRIISAGPIIESATRYRRQLASGDVEPYARTRVGIATPEDARRVVDSIASLGADFIKMRSAESLAVYRAVAVAARARGLPLAAHGDVAPAHEITRAGQRSVEHAFLPPLQRLPDTTRGRLMREMAAAGTAIVPTLVNYYGWLLVPRDRARRLIDDSTGRLDPRRPLLSGTLIADWREQLTEREGLLEPLVRRLYLPRVFRRVLRDYRELHRAGVRLLPGSDIAVALMYPGWSLHDELGYFVDTLGLSPMEALMSATRHAAAFSGMLDSLGTIEAGKAADLVLLDADPLADIRNVGRIAAVVSRGRLVDRSRR